MRGKRVIDKDQNIFLLYQKCIMHIRKGTLFSAHVKMKFVK